ncbi:MAG: hypothetical protein RJA99_1180 [Pseudomonadota bacterium]
MQVPTPFPFRRAAPRVAAAAALALALAELAAPARAAEVRLRGEAGFRVPADTVLAALPADAPVGAADLRGGRLSFELVYDDAARDVDPDPHAGRYDAAVRAFRVRIGGTLLELPASSVRIVVSDGGLGRAWRESVVVQADARSGDWGLQVSWTQLNQVATATDLRGASGMLADDRLPPPARLAALPTSGEFDRAFLLRLDAPGGTAGRPALYLSTSTLTVAPVAAAAR